MASFSFLYAAAVTSPLAHAQERNAAIGKPLQDWGTGTTPNYNLQLCWNHAGNDMLLFWEIGDWSPCQYKYCSYGPSLYYSSSH